MMQNMQAGFAGFDPPVATDRLFLALFPDAETAARISALAATQCRLQGLHGKPLRTDRLHVTLFHLGDWAGVPDDVVAAVGRAVDPMHEPGFELAFDVVMSFATRRAQKPFVLKAAPGNQVLHGFRSRLARMLGNAGLVRWTRGGFEPHVTLAYDTRLVSPQAVEPLVWPARELVLVHSLLGQTRHVPLARWALAG